jgi:carbonic anhydrase
MSEQTLPPGLRTGFNRFKETRWAAERERYRQLAEEGQRPETMVIACSDSRVGPELLFDARPGELFAVRNVAALVPAYAPDEGNHAASAALEYAVLTLGVRSIVVMGHGRCGGVAAVLDGKVTRTSTDFIGTWVHGLRDLARVLDASDPAGADKVSSDVERRVVERSLANLRTFPWIQSREQAGVLSLHGCWFDIGVGELHELTASGWGRVGPAERRPTRQEPGRT